jgi:hypothetical protein
MLGNHKVATHLVASRVLLSSTELGIHLRIRVVLPNDKKKKKHYLRLPERFTLIPCISELPKNFEVIPDSALQTKRQKLWHTQLMLTSIF